MKTTSHPNIYLIGPMGSGKSSIGKQLADLCHLPFYDSDTEIQQRTGVEIGWIFEVETEAGFRKREADVIAELTQQRGIILATGGGAITTASNREHLRNNGIVVYLCVSLQHQLKRTERNKLTRPLLVCDNPKQKLIELNQQREPLYRQIADLTYNTNDINLLSLAQKIWADVQDFKRQP